MFGFTAHFADDVVFINGKKYCSNEILTSCLNILSDDMRDVLARLCSLRTAAQIKDSDKDRSKFNRAVEEAQEIFLHVGSIIKKLPPYNKMNELVAALDSPLLLNCIHDTDGVLDDGFVLARKTNKAIRILFDQFISIVEDMVRIRFAYTQLLDDYIHCNRKYPSNTEAADIFERYFSETERCSDLMCVRSSGSLEITHGIHFGRFCDTYNFESLGAFIYVDFFRGLERLFIPRRCDNCGLYFLLKSGAYSNYCERPLKEDKEKTCRIVGSRRRFDDKCKNNPVWLAYTRAYKAHYARYMKKKMTTSEFEEWSHYALELRDKAERGEIEYEKYVACIRI